MSDSSSTNKEKPIFKTIRRKIQIVGGNTITISLPRTWARKNKIGRGKNEDQEVAIRYHPDGSLIITPSHTKLHRIDRTSRHKIGTTTSIAKIKRIMLADFIGGIDNINLVAKKGISSDKMQDIHEFVITRMNGFQVIEHENLVEIINMTETLKFNLARFLEIIRVQSTRMIKSCYIWLGDNEYDAERIVNEMNNWEKPMNRQVYQMMRLLQLCIFDFSMAERVGLPPGEILHWSAVIRAAESAADLAVAIAEIAPILEKTQTSNKLKKELYQLGDTSSTLFSDAMSSFLKRDGDKAQEVLDTESIYYLKTHQKWPVKVESLTPTEALMMRHLEKIGIYAKKIAEATIDCEATRTAFYSS